MSFTHLEVHSHYTLLGATPSPAELADRAAAQGMARLALTDANALYGAVAYAQACERAGVQPIIGMAVSVAGPAAVSGAPDAPGQVVLLADGPEGYRSLCRLSSLIQADPDREAVAARGLGWEALERHRAGLFAVSGGRRSWVERYLRAGAKQAAREYAARLAGIYEDRARLGLEIHRPEDVAVAGEVIALGQRFGLDAVAMQPVYCLAPADHVRLRLLSAIRQNVPLAQLPLADPDETPRWLDPGEVAERFARFPAAVAAAGEVAAACRPALPGGEPIWPELHLPPGQTADDALADRARAGLAAQYGSDPFQAVVARLARELAAIAAHGVAPLFLVVADIVRFSREAGVPVSTRGSVANSLVAYCTGITTVDPIEHDLLFERFLNPARRDIPDIDLDFCSRRRDEVLAYIRDAYGPDRVAIIGTISTMQPQSAVREAGKAFGLPEADIDRLARLTPHRWHPDPRRRDRRTLEEIAATLEDAREREVLRAAQGLVGQPDHLSLHPGGMVITPGPLTDTVPVQWSPKGFLATQFEHEYVEALGLPKMDLLGIRALTVLADTAALVRAHHAPEFTLEAIPLDDPATGDLLARAETIGVFQCESEGAQSTLRKLRVRTVRDLAVANAFFKPGPATGGMAAAFVRRYRGQEAVGYLHPSLAPILGPTQGVLIFQEQILRVAREIAGLSWAQADQLRKGMSHFGVEQMTALQQQFAQGCQRPPPDGPGMTAAQAATLWEQVVAFAGYGFNQGHATAYADVSYRSAYLKAHWPAAFLCARLADHGGFHHPAIYMAEARRLGIAVRPPHVNHSGAAFTYEPEPSAALWMGLGQVRDLRQKAIERIVAARAAAGPYAGLADLLARVDLQTTEVRHLVACGALDGLMGRDRHALLVEATGSARRGRQPAGQLALPLPDEIPTSPVGSGAPPAPDLAQLREIVRWEKEILGLPVSVHPLELVRGELPPYTPLREAAGRRGRPVAVAGVRLPGWTGGQSSFFLDDGETFVTVRLPREGLTTPPAWQPALVEGRWQEDEFGNAWLQAERITVVGGAGS
jgi:DNA-directed DNA polymerase III PolC